MTVSNLKCFIRAEVEGVDLNSKILNQTDLSSQFTRAGLMHQKYFKGKFCTWIEIHCINDLEINKKKHLNECI